MLEKVELPHGWYVEMLVDEDKHLNIFIVNSDNTEVVEVLIQQGHDEFSLRLTTKGIEEEYDRENDEDAD